MHSFMSPCASRLPARGHKRSWCSSCLPRSQYHVMPRGSDYTSPATPDYLLQKLSMRWTKQVSVYIFQMQDFWLLGIR